jgi:hypothetical protein
VASAATARQLKRGVRIGFGGFVGVGALDPRK